MADEIEQLGQDALIHADAQTGEMFVHDFSRDGVVDLNESRLQRLHVLELFKQINQRERFYGHPTAAEARYGDNARAARDGAYRNRNEMVKEAQAEFYNSLGLPLVLATEADFPEFDARAFEIDAKRMWTKFQAKFRSQSHSAARNDYMRRLRRRVMYDQTMDNQIAESRQYISSVDQKKVAEKTGRVYPVLSSRERLQAIQEDPRAGFIPFTDKEKIKVITWLDYLDNPEYPLGTYNQLLEINSRQQSHKVKNRQRRGLALAQETLRSVVYELHDHWANALETQASLNDLEIATAGIYPGVKITEIMSTSHPALVALIRYSDAVAYRDSGKHPRDVANPLSTREDRREHLIAEKHKTIEDRYTGKANMTPAMDAYLKREIRKLTVESARKLLVLALANEQARAAFHGDRLREISEGIDSKFLPTSLAKELLKIPRTLNEHAA